MPVTRPDKALDLGSSVRFAFAQNVAELGNPLLDSAEFSPTDQEYLVRQQQAGCWVFTMSSDLPSEARNHAIRAIEENEFDAFLKRWVAVSLPPVSRATRLDRLGFGFASEREHSAVPSLHLDSNLPRWVWGSRASGEWIASRPKSDHLGSAREQLAALDNLAADWDSYGAEPIPRQTLDHALAVIDSIVNAGGVAQSIDATTESTVFIRSIVESFVVEFEIDDSDVVGVALKPSHTPPSYHDVPLEALEEFLVFRHVR